MISKLIITSILIHTISESNQIIEISLHQKELHFKPHSDPTKNTIELISKLMTNFNNDFAVTFHYENKSKQIVGDVIKNLNSSKLICGVYNYDYF